MFERTFSLTGDVWHVFEVRNHVLLRHFEACAPRDLLLFKEPETLRSTKFPVNGEYIGRIRRVDRTQRCGDPHLVGIVRGAKNTATGAGNRQYLCAV